MCMMVSVSVDLSSTLGCFRQIYLTGSNKPINHEHENSHQSSGSNWNHVHNSNNSNSPL